MFQEGNMSGNYNLCVLSVESITLQSNDSLCQLSVCGK